MDEELLVFSNKLFVHNQIYVYVTRSIGGVLQVHLRPR